MKYSIVLILAVYLIGIVVPESNAAPNKESGKGKDTGETDAEDIFKQLITDDGDEGFEELSDESDDEEEGEGEEEEEEEKSQIEKPSPPRERQLSKPIKIPGEPMNELPTQSLKKNAGVEDENEEEKLSNIKDKMPEQSKNEKKKGDKDNKKNESPIEKKIPPVLKELENQIKESELLNKKQTTRSQNSDSEAEEESDDDEKRAEDKSAQKPLLSKASSNQKDLPTRKDKVQQKQSPPPKTSDKKPGNLSSKNLQSTTKGPVNLSTSSTKKFSTPAGKNSVTRSITPPKQSTPSSQSKTVAQRPPIKATAQRPPIKATAQRPPTPRPNPNLLRATPPRLPPSSAPKPPTGKVSPLRGSSPAIPKSSQVKAPPARKPAPPKISQKPVTTPVRKVQVPAVNVSAARSVSPVTRTASSPARTREQKQNAQKVTPAQAIARLANSPSKKLPAPQKPKSIPVKVPAPQAAATAAKQKVDKELEKKAAELKKNIEALTPVSLISALSQTAQTSPNKLDSIAPHLENVIKSLEGTPLENYFKSINLLIDAANDN